MEKLASLPRRLIQIPTSLIWKLTTLRSFMIKKFLLPIPKKVLPRDSMRFPSFHRRIQFLSIKPTFPIRLPLHILNMRLLPVHYLVRARNICIRTIIPHPMSLPVRLHSRLQIIPTLKPVFLIRLPVHTTVNLGLLPVHITATVVQGTVV